MGWQVQIKQKVERRQILRLPKEVRALVYEAISDLKEEGPFPFGWNVKEIKKGECRMWLKRKWRMKYIYEKSELCIEVIYTGSKEGVEY
jgi:mRNA-degrading endonuclease RelE of RelBE toxin-antitoxin system